MVNEEENLGDAVVDRETGQGQKVAYLVAQLEKWTRRALAFQEGYKDKAFEVTALEIQLLDLRAHGVDKVTARINDALKTKMLAACIERNEARDALRGLLRGHKCWCSTWVGGGGASTSRSALPRLPHLSTSPRSGLSQTERMTGKRLKLNLLSWSKQIGKGRSFNG